VPAIKAVYLVPRGAVVRSGRIHEIAETLSKCQSFFARQAGISVEWSVRRSPIRGENPASAYNQSHNLAAEVLDPLRSGSAIVGVFFEGSLSEPAYGTLSMDNLAPQHFVIAQPYISMLGGRGDVVVAHEIGHTLGLPHPSGDGYSIMGGIIASEALDEQSLFPWTRPHLSRSERRYLRNRWIIRDAERAASDL